MARDEREYPHVTVTDLDAVDEVVVYPLEHLVHKAPLLDWTRSSGPAAGNAPSDLARSLVGDVLGDPKPAPARYRKVTLHLAGIPYEGGEITEEEILELIQEETDAP